MSAAGSRRSGQAPVATTLLVSVDADWALTLAERWAREGAALTVVLLDAAAACARPKHPQAARLREAGAAGVRLAVESGALRRRGLTRGAIVDGLDVVDLDDVADVLTDETDRVMWL